MKIHVVHEKWCDATPGIETSSAHNIDKSIVAAYPAAEYTFSYIDQYFYETSMHIDHKLLTEPEADLYIICYLGDSHLNPSVECLKKLKNSKKIFLWPDTVWHWFPHLINRLSEVADEHISWDAGIKENQLVNILGKLTAAKFNTKLPLFGVTPQNDTILIPKHKDITVSFVGASHGERKAILDSIVNLKNLGNTKFILDGQRNRSVDYNNYIDIISRSCITINFPMSGNNLYTQSKGRVFEAFACGTLILNIIPDRFIDSVEKPYPNIVPCFSATHAVDYLKSLSEKHFKDILEQGKEIKNLYNKYFHSSIYWKELIKPYEQ